MNKKILIFSLMCLSIVSIYFGIWEKEKIYDNNGELIQERKFNRITKDAQIYFYNPQGEIIKIIKSDRNQKEVNIEFFENGILNQILQKRSDKKFDVRSYFSTNGNLIGYYNEIEGKREGYAEFYDDNGEIKAQSFYEDGQMCIKNLYFKDESSNLDSMSISYFPLIDIKIQKSAGGINDTVGLRFRAPSFNKFNDAKILQAHFDITTHSDSLFEPSLTYNIKTESEYLYYLFEEGIKEEHLFGYLVFDGDTSRNLFFRKIE